MAEGATVNVFNCGKAGSDPFFNFKVFKDQLLGKKPDMVILSINLTDVLDIAVRGGMERFKPDGTITYNRPPKSYSLFKYSRIYRYIMVEFLGYDYNMIKISDSQVLNKSKSLLNFAVQMFQSTCESHDIPFLVVAHPVPNSPPCEQRSTLLSEVDMNDCSETLFYLLQSLYDNGGLTEYYWPMDGHFNKAGYRIIGSEVARYLLRHNLIFARK